MSVATFPGASRRPAVPEPEELPAAPDLTVWAPPPGLKAAGLQFWRAFGYERAAMHAMHSTDRALLTSACRLIDQVEHGRPGLTARDVMRRLVGFRETRLRLAGVEEVDRLLAGRGDGRGWLPRRYGFGGFWRAFFSSRCFWMFRFRLSRNASAKRRLSSDESGDRGLG